MIVLILLALLVTFLDLTMEIEEPVKKKQKVLDLNEELSSDDDFFKTIKVPVTSTTTSTFTSFDLNVSKPF
jgi:hypothetical protein